MFDLLEKFSFRSSEVDWCESNFVISDFVAEFYNTISNVLFFIFPPLLIYLFRHYARRVTSDINVVWGLLLVVGLGSVYFHATLSLAGQLIDEIAIIWVFMAALALYCPHRVLPNIFQKDRHLFRQFMLISTVLTSGLACIHPAINHVAMFIMAVPATLLLAMELKQCKSRRVYHLGLRCLFTWLFAIGSWVSDRIMCGVWESLGIPFLHSGWHIFVCLGGYQTIVLFAYFDAVARMPAEEPVVRYWPHGRSDWMSIPYVSFKVLSVKPPEKI